MLSKRKPVEVFVSYSHRDRKHLDKLRVNLAGLERAGRVHFWWDGEIEVGKAWAPQLVQALLRADVVILLLTANFMASDYCIEEELRQARKREEDGKIDLIPVLVEPFDIDAHWLGQLQVITVNGKAITQSRLGPAAWEQVARQIRFKIEVIEGRRPVGQVLDVVEETAHSGTHPLPGVSTQRQTVPMFPTVSAFWRVDPALLGELISVQGTFSQFAPMLMGRPLAKRALHLEFRKAIETHRRFGERKRLTINACMSISAGQMVHREVRTEHSTRLLGLYESIARNAVPVFVLQEYYEQEVLPTLLDTAGSGCFEAIVTGRLFLLDNNFIRRFLACQGIDKLIDASVIDDLCRDAYALQVGAPGTKVHRLRDQATRYLDGDIWLALKSDRGERFVTGFVDITSEAERSEEMKRLRVEAHGNRILASYDELQSIAQLVEHDGD